MKNEQKLKLIEGSFSPVDAKEVLLNVFSSKIQFHQMKNFSSQERFGKDDVTAATRIPQLKKTISQILKIIADAEEQGATLELESEVIVRSVEIKKM